MKPAHELKKEREERFAYERGRRISKLEEEHKDLIDEIYSEIEKNGSCAIMGNSDYLYNMDTETYFAVIDLFKYYGYSIGTVSELVSGGIVSSVVYIYLP